MKFYVLVVRNTRMHLIGAFNTSLEASEWGLRNNPDDDPRWQVVQLPESRFSSECGGISSMHLNCFASYYAGVPRLMRSTNDVDNGPFNEGNV